MPSTLPKSRRPVSSRHPSPKVLRTRPFVLSPEDCFRQFTESLRNIGDFPAHWLNSFRIQSSDMTLVRTLNIESDLTCVISSSPRLEHFLQENASPLVRVGEPLFDRLAVEFIQRMAHLCLGTTLMVAPQIQPGIPKSLQGRKPDTVCKMLVDVTFVEVMLFRGPITER